MASRTDPNLTDKLAAMIVLHFGIPRGVAKSMSRGEILALVDWDHDPVPVAIAKALNWPPDAYNHPSNLSPRLPPDHRIKTSKQDVPQIAKAERITVAHTEF